MDLIATPCTRIKKMNISMNKLGDKKGNQVVALELNEDINKAKPDPEH